MVAYDAGPGNGLVDSFVKRRTKGQDLMDLDGKYGGRGVVQEQLLLQMYSEAVKVPGYFERAPPKSLDIGDLEVISGVEELCLEDGCATLEAFTADCLVRSLESLGGIEELKGYNLPKLWILVGGGWNNPIITKQLEMRLKQKIGGDVELKHGSEVGWHSKSLEAQIFAYLAIRSLQGLPISYPLTTQVPHPLTGGTLHEPKQSNRTPPTHN
eukprot:TRINITY_DN3546_c0_g1_i1.p1 TRINITY_DN3546_c0_g1~~TRINITY_DN3546_c0_g1_i1.p1  ORF type:complete len:212 (+),score=55.27 TRINITY_DN3546_c0_g1_i1:752-1387(+)